MESKKAAIVFDRDGTLIDHIPYLHCPDKVKLLPTVRASLKMLLEAGFLLFLHTNQSGVGRKMFDIERVHACNKKLIELLDLGPTPFKRICIAPESPSATSFYRKPSPQFAFELMRDFNLKSEEICYVGDRASDLATAVASGTYGLGVDTGLENLQEELRYHKIDDKFLIFSSMEHVAQHLISNK